MPSYKLTYFDIYGLGEPIRYLLSYAAIDFIDNRVKAEDWPKIKPTTPFGQMPVLEVDNKKISQSTAICRYLAKQFGLAGKDDWESLEIDAAVDTILDFDAKIVAAHYEINDKAKAQKLAIAKETLPFYLQRFNEQVKKNSGYFVGEKLTWADLFFVALLDYTNLMAGYDIIEKYHNLKMLREKVLKVPRISKWVANRPKTGLLKL